MNPARLRQSLRQGGWHRCARNLPRLVNAAVAEPGGLPLSRYDGSTLVLFDVDASGELYARLEDGRVIADEHAIQVRRPRVREVVRSRSADVYVGAKVPTDLARRLDREAKTYPGGRSGCVRSALRYWLLSRRA